MFKTTGAKDILTKKNEVINVLVVFNFGPY